MLLIYCEYYVLRFKDAFFFNLVFCCAANTFLRSHCMDLQFWGKLNCLQNVFIKYFSPIKCCTLFVDSYLLQT